MNEETLPSGFPKHQIWDFDDINSWRSPVSLEHETTYHRITVNRRTHCIDAAFEILHEYRKSKNGEVLIIDGSAENNEECGTQTSFAWLPYWFEKQSLEQIPSLASLAQLEDW